MGEKTVTNKLRVVGDFVDLTHMKKHGTDDLDVPYNRQILAQLMRKADRGTDVAETLGNHEAPIRDKKTKYKGMKVAHRNMCGRTLYGIKCLREDEHEVVPGFLLKLEHGDAHDGSNGRYPKEITSLLGVMSDIDTGVHNIPGLEGVSLAQALKKRIKKMKKWEKINRGIAAYIDQNSRFAAILTGHDHMGGHILRTPLGKYMLNDDNCTEHVKMIVHDKNGKFALIEWHKHYMLVTEEGKKPIRVTWNQLGLPHFHQPMPLHDDQYTYQADRIIRIIKRMSPSRNRKKQVQGWRKESKRCSANGREYTGHTTAFLDTPKPQYHAHLWGLHTRQVERLAS